MPTKTTKKPVAKKTTVKKVAAPAPEMHEHECACGAECKCGCHGGCGFCRVMKKIIVLLIVFALGFVAAKFCCCPKHHPGMPRAEFVNGCLDTSSVKNPKFMDALPALDINHDGCITREEYMHAKKHMRNEVRENAPTIEDEPVAAEDAE